ncbi:MAG: imidazole glycerol phosphate synthase, glutamine amidotransferase subunit [Flavobacteria bacterium RIFCSPLOWO2_12_FULL_35_11]|nr:MAG: imidazole glycerol phosphate synthase, glutamine amidotransferase subunit [Flavobacteria bacterium RIFCSPLOWO2_12_FULL_35_11]
MISIIDYNMGNLRYVANAFVALGQEVMVTSNPNDLRSASAIILPGVGAFSDGKRNLEKLGFIEILNEEVIEKGKPYLGICLGMQFLAQESYENGCHKGFGWINGNVKRIKPCESKYKVPHMGWNNVQVQRKDGLFVGLGEGPVFYFVHSYCLDIEESSFNYVTSTCWHGVRITASVQKENIFGVQFHPEKSQGAGLKLLKNFVDTASGATNA